jgi:hypothetical protein
VLEISPVLPVGDRPASHFDRRVVAQTDRNSVPLRRAFDRRHGERGFWTSTRCRVQRLHDRTVSGGRACGTGSGSQPQTFHPAFIPRAPPSAAGRERPSTRLTSHFAPLPSTAVRLNRLPKLANDDIDSGLRQNGKCRCWIAVFAHS